jgi:transcriptional regulator of aromatic amino acid metabolism
VLTTTPSPLFPLVESGAFLAALYYRLNMLLLLV